MAHINSVRRLREHELQFSKKEFKARGAALKRCTECMLEQRECICGSVSPVDTELGVCMLMYHAEYYKPSNTGQLICEVVPDNFAYRWQRTEVQDELLSLLNSETWFPIIVFVHDATEPARQIHNIPAKSEIDGKRPLLIFLDGTWRQAKKMFIKSPYLDSFPVLQLSGFNKGAYQLRESYHEHHLSTVEVAFELFKQNGELELGDTLERLFDNFRTAYQVHKR
ncbi:tRNA-uridine aminocarboxypropyltransferase [Psychrosphaera aestuarii]|uniref:tRNA-uridine aminocarboxypropyltransferase n=1 Tax=Psychrosphaera aestuarii TaxID=1266052 RepID=UPI001B32FB2E|nr:DTW domain-containing protein [Psychrosphaera aestuarii]